MTIQEIREELANAMIDAVYASGTRLTDLTCKIVTLQRSLISALELDIARKSMYVVGRAA